MKPEKIGGVQDWQEYKKQFLVVARLNQWDDEEKALHLVGNLTGAAKSILFDQPDQATTSWDKVVRRIERKYSSLLKIGLLRSLS